MNEAKTRRGVVALADVTDEPLIAIGGELGFTNPVHELTLEQIEDGPLHWLTINGISFLYESEEAADDDLTALLSGERPVRLTGTGNADEWDALFERHGVTVLPNPIRLSVPALSL